MTKEAIFKRIALDDGYVTDKSMFAVEDDRELVYKAMDEYAKQFGEKLIGWLNDNDFKPSSFKDNMQSDYVNNGERMHASEIVDLFIEQQNKDNA